MSLTCENGVEKLKSTAQERETIQDKEGANEEGSEARCIDINDMIIKHALLYKKKNHSKIASE